MDVFASIFKSIGSISMVVLKLVLFIVLSVLVLPSMLIMTFLHEHWEKMLDDVVTLNPF